MAVVNQPNNFVMHERYGNYIVNPQIIAGTVCHRGVILNGPNVRPTVILAIRHTTIETANLFAEKELPIYRMLRVIPSPFVARMIAEHTITTNNQPSGRIIIMPAANGTNLHTVLSTRGPMPLALACRMLVQITAGVAHCHSHRIVLRDITVGHIFFAEENRRTAFLGDLSHSKIVLPNPAHPGKAWLTEKCGTPPYIAQEILTQQAYDGFASDIYALGVVFFVALFGRFPYFANTPAALHAQIVNGQIEWPAGCPEQVISLLQRMLDRNPNTRIKANQILSLPWLADLVAENGIVVGPIEEENEEEDSDDEDETDDEDSDDDMEVNAIDNNDNDIDRDPSVGN